jgi:hypothetical protein
MKGYLTNQKSVLIFQRQDWDKVPSSNKGVLITFEAKGKLEDIHRNL